MLEDFKQLIRAMPISEFKTLSELPIAKKYLPYLRGLKADFSTKVNPQVTAMTFSSAAADHETPIEVHGHKLTLKMVRFYFEYSTTIIVFPLLRLKKHLK